MIRYSNKTITDKLSRTSIFILLLPYLILSLKEVENFYWLIIPCSLLFFLMDLFLSRFKNKMLSYLFLNGIIYIFYSLIFYVDTLYIIQNVSFKHFSLVFIAITAIVFYFLLFKSKNHIFLNTIIIIFCFLQAFSFENEISVVKILKRYNLNSSHLYNKPLNQSTSPIILIIADGLSSSKEIFDKTQNIKDLKLNEFLISNNYLIKPKFKSESRWTQYSISSLLNFNFHKSDSLKTLENLEGSGELFQEEFKLLVNKNLLVDSLNNKNIKSYSYGLTPFHKGQQVDNVVYMWGKEKYNFNIEFLKDYKWLQIFFHKSVFNFIDQRFLNGTSYLFDTVRKEALFNLENVEFKNNSFYFFHYFAPHSPFSYFEEFPLIPLNSQNVFEEHVKYRRFMIQKLIDVLSMEKFNNTRIIITGDHGFRSEITDQYITQIGFKGFEKESIDQLRSLQDLGSLILKSFKNNKQKLY